MMCMAVGTTGQRALRRVLSAGEPPPLLPLQKVVNLSAPLPVPCDKLSPRPADRPAWDVSDNDMAPVGMLPILFCMEILCVALFLLSGE